MEITNQVYLYGKKKFKYILIGNIVEFLMLFLLMWFSVALADSVFYFSEVTRWGLFFINIPYVLFLFRKLIFGSFRNWSSLNLSSDLTQVAIEIGEGSVNSSQQIELPPHDLVSTFYRKDNERKLLH